MARAATQYVWHSIQTSLMLQWHMSSQPRRLPIFSRIRVTQHNNMLLHVWLQHAVRQSSVITPWNFASQCVLASVHGKHMCSRGVMVHTLEATTRYIASISFPEFVPIHVCFHVWHNNLQFPSSITTPMRTAQMWLPTRVCQEMPLQILVGRCTAITLTSCATILFFPLRRIHFQCIHTHVFLKVRFIQKFVHLLRSATFYNYYQSYKHVYKDNQQNLIRFQHAHAHISLRPTHTSWIKSILYTHNEHQCNVFFSNSHQTAY